MKFFEGSDAGTAKIEWYFVPPSRSCLPVPSFVDSTDWYSPNGPGAGMMVGLSAKYQGEQIGRRPGKRSVALPWEKYTGHYCGTPAQWLGELDLSNPKDVGEVGCCKGPNYFVAISGSRADVDFNNFTFVCLHATSGSVVNETDAAGVTEDFASCSCSAVEESHAPDRLEEFQACSCSAADAEFTGEGDTVGCSCSEVTFTATVTSETLDFSSCSCSEVDVSSHSVEPGTDCSSAGELSVPFSITVPIAGPATQWWKFPAPTGVQYYCKITSAIIGLTCDIRGFITDCDGTQFRVGIWSSNGCVSRTPSVDELCAPKITCPPLLSGTYTLEIGTGPCP